MKVALAGLVAAALLAATPAYAEDRTALARDNAAEGPLAGRTIVVDPGHQLGNHNFPSEINEPVPAGGFTKPCNTTGTATRGGYPEATFAWRVALRLKA